MSSVSIGSDTNWVMSSKNLNTIWSVDARPPHGEQWRLSTSLPDSTYSFKGNDDDDNPEHFYAPHTVSQLANGNIMFIDDGAGRPGCGISFDDNSIGNQDGCFSRAICYQLDPATRKVSVKWQFEVPYALNERSYGDWAVEERDLWNEVGGSVYKLANGNYLISFTSVSDQEKYDAQATCYAYEVDVDGGAIVRSELAIPTPVSEQGKQNGYRLKPWESIGGERTASPL